MNTEKGFWHWSKIAGISIATLAWAWLFHANYWDASIPAFGDVAGHLADLRVLLWKYMGAGAAVAVGWYAALKPAPRRSTSTEATPQVRMHSNL